MKITIQKTMYLEELPEEIDTSFDILDNRLVGAKQILNLASQDALEGRYVDASESLERLREVLALIDKNLEEQQSLMLSYEKIRIASQFPEQETNDEQ